jgi:TIR domain
VARVFVSYASQDRVCAAQLRQWLVAEGHAVFLDRDLGHGIAVGEEWDKRLHERLRWADAVVCVVTSAAVASMWCTAEVSIALSRGSRVLPVLAEPRVGHPLLPCVQYADLTVDAVAGRAALVGALRRVDAVEGLGWPGWCDPRPSGLRGRCCWWWAPRGVAFSPAGAPWPPPVPTTPRGCGKLTSIVSPLPVSARFPIGGKCPGEGVGCDAYLAMTQGGFLELDPGGSPTWIRLATDTPDRYLPSMRRLTKDYAASRMVSHGCFKIAYRGAVVASFRPESRLHWGSPTRQEGCPPPA